MRPLPIPIARWHHLIERAVRGIATGLELAEIRYHSADMVRIFRKPRHPHPGAPKRKQDSAHADA